MGRDAFPKARHTPVVEDAPEGGVAPRRRPHRHLVPPDPRTRGNDPDYRFSLANERTFLAWIRTSLALAAAGLGAASLLDDFPGEEVLGVGLLVLSFVTASMSYRRWALTETAIRVEEPLPGSRLPLVLAGGVASIVVASAVLVLVSA
jgi:putative membrane protein